ncbi:hypothetical protein LOTGIDRAFT_147573, partial [Lottia gigantea]
VHSCQEKCLVIATSTFIYRKVPFSLLLVTFMYRKVSCHSYQYIHVQKSVLDSYQYIHVQKSVLS